MDCPNLGVYMKEAVYRALLSAMERMTECFEYL
jgi:hypothetical protein